MSTQFGEKYRRWSRITKAAMSIHHKPGDAMQVDWAGDTIQVYDPVTGKPDEAYLFVAVLPCSYYTYAEACCDMKSENWLSCHVRAFDYLGGRDTSAYSLQLQDRNRVKYPARACT